MSLNSVQLYFKSMLNGISLPTAYTTNLQAFVAPPTINPNISIGAQCYIWGSESEHDRKTMGQRGQLANGSFRGGKYDIDVWVIWYQDLTAAAVDSEFPAVLDTVRVTIERSPDQVHGLLDTTTGYVSDLLAVGDHNKQSYGSWKAAAPQSTLVSVSGRLQCTVVEWYLM